MRRDRARKTIKINGRRMTAGSSRYNSTSVYLDGDFKPRKKYRVVVTLKKQS